MEASRHESEYSEPTAEDREAIAEMFEAGLELIEPRSDAGLERLFEAPMVFGLRAQGHLPRVEQMLAVGASWQEIGEAIGWDGETARRYYEMEAGGAA